MRPEALPCPALGRSRGRRPQAAAGTASRQWEAGYPRLTESATRPAPPPPAARQQGGERLEQPHSVAGMAVVADVERRHVECRPAVRVRPYCAAPRNRLG